MPSLAGSLKLVQRLWLSVFLLACAAAAVVYFDRLVPAAAPSLTLRWQYLAPLLVGQFAFWLVLARTWSRLVATLTGHRLPLLSSFMQSSLVTLGKYLPGKVWGMAARSGYLLRRGIQVGDSVAATYFEQSLLLHAGLVLSSLLAAALWPNWLTWTAALIAMASLPLAVRLGNRFLALAVSWYAKLARRATPARIHAIARAEYFGFLARFALVWLASGVVFASIYFGAFAVEPTPRMIAALLLANTASISLGFVAVFAPGGIGVREAAMVFLLAPLMPVEHAIALSVFSRLWLIATDLTSGLAAYTMVRLAPRGR